MKTMMPPNSDDSLTNAMRERGASLWSAVAERSADTAFAGRLRRSNATDPAKAVSPGPVAARHAPLPPHSKGWRYVDPAKWGGVLGTLRNQVLMVLNVLK